MWSSWRRLLAHALGNYGTRFPSSLGDCLPEVVLGHGVVRNPCHTHVIDRTLAVADPIIRIQVQPVAGGIVVPTDEVQNGTSRQEWLRFRCVFVNHHPIE